MPFITEEIWQVLPGVRPITSIMLADYPTGAGLPTAAEDAAKMEQLMDVIRAIRNIRGEMDVPPSKTVAAVFDCRSAGSEAVLRDGEGYIRTLARVADLQVGVGIEHPAQAATQVAGEVEIFLPLAGLVDVEEEEKRLEKEIAKVQKDVDFFKKKLSNEKFVANAPAEVLEKDRAKLAEAEDKLGVLQQGLEKILALK